MVHYIQLIYVKKGKEEIFHSFEDLVLPYLEKYEGVLIYRIRPVAGLVIRSTIGHPYEIHMVTFPSREMFKAYMSDSDRLKHMSLKDSSVEKVVLIEGTQL